MKMTVKSQFFLPIYNRTSHATSYVKNVIIANEEILNFFPLYLKMIKFVAKIFFCLPFQERYHHFSRTHLSHLCFYTPQT